MQQLSLILKNMSGRGKAMAAAGAVGALIVFVLLARLATAPSYETLMTGVDPAKAGEMTRTLDEQGIAYELQNGGTALAVQPAQAPQARIALAEQGLGGGEGQPGFELFDEQKLGTSDFQQKVTYQRALEGEIGKTIEGVEGVSGAQVQLVLPEDDLFAEDVRPATAAVLLSGATAELDPAAVRGMAQLVSSSVEGLKLDKVSITDGGGRLLWPREGADGSFGATGKQAAEERHDTALEAQLTALLARTVGPDKAQVQVASELNVDKARERTLRYGQEGVALRRKTEAEQLEGQGGAAGGRAGTGGNIPGYAGGAAGGGESNYDRESEDAEFGVDKTVRDTEIAPGAVERQSISVLLDASIPAATAAQLNRAVAAAAGVDRQRGDTITMSRVAFAKAPAPEATAAGMGAYTPYAKWAALGLGALIFLFLVSRGLKKREREALGEPMWLREVTAPESLAALEAQQTLALPSPVGSARQRAEQLAAKDPEKVASQLRQWMHAEA